VPRAGRESHEQHRRAARASLSFVSYLTAEWFTFRLTRTIGRRLGTLDLPMQGRSTMTSMRTGLRTVLLCLLALAIPLQGLAAAARLSCGMRHHEMAQPHAGMPASDHAAAAGDAGHDHDRAPCGGVTVKCDACATCAASATATPPVFTAALADKASYLRIPFFERYRASELPGRLERPPRTISL